VAWSAPIKLSSSRRADDDRRLQPGLSPVVGSTLVPEGHGVAVVVTAAPDAANERSKPRAPIDAVDGAAAVPFRLLGHDQIVEVEVGI
jgi:hypothetical protein